MRLHDAHPDEGTIHAWLDGELDAAAALDLEVHVAGCADCRARVAEARGLIAGASRIVRTLDDPAPAGVPRSWGDAIPPAPTAATAPRADRTSAWRFLRLTPARAAIAATLLVAVGITLTRVSPAPEPISIVSNSGESRVAAPRALDSTAGTAPAATPTGAPTANPSAPPTVATTSAAPSASRAAPIRPRDHLLDSAIARNLAQAQPPRTIGAATGGSIPQPTPTSPALTDSAGRTRVAVARAAIRAQRETAGDAADRTRVASTVASADAAPLERSIAAAKAADSTVNAPARRVPTRAGVAGEPAAAAAPSPSVAPTSQPTSSGECYRVESATGAMGAWGSVPLPFVVALDAGSGTARIIGPSGAETDSRAVWTRGGADSLLLTLRHTNFVGSLTLGARGDVRAGVMRSHPTAAVALRRRTARPRGSRTELGIPSADAIEAAPAVPVVARRLACPAH